MRISRLRVEGGFLDGLDLKLSSGLVVLVGERGTGKSTLLELLALGTQATDAETTSFASDDVRDMVGDGSIELTVMGGAGTNEEVHVWTPAHEDGGYSTALTSLIIRQGRMESIGKNNASRLSLLDQQAPRKAKREASALASARSRIRSQTVELRSLRKSVADLHLDLIELEGVAEDLSAARQVQAELLEKAEVGDEQAAQLATLQGQLGAMRLSRDYARDADAFLDQTRQRLSELASSLDAPSLPKNASDVDEELKSSVDAALVGVKRQLELAVASLETASREIAGEESARSAELARTTASVRELRERLEETKAGLADASRKVDKLIALETRKGSLTAKIGDLEASLKVAADARLDQYSTVDAIRDERHERRSAAAERVNADSGPQIRLKLVKNGARAAYEAVIRDCLRGSGLHYNTIAPELAEKLSPLELTEIVERVDVGALASATGYSDDRCAVILSVMSAADVQELPTAEVEDDTTLSLMDGGTYKPSNELSIGQRCTAVLPLVLAAQVDLLLLDQPEDNLDNAYLASAIVGSLRARAESGQIIVATHNPNVPVLADASQVVELGSDGSRGFVKSSDQLRTSTSRRAISEVLEGGDEAFATRADFYDAP